MLAQGFRCHLHQPVRLQAFKLAEQAASQPAAVQQQQQQQQRGPAGQPKLPVDAAAVIRRVMAAQDAFALLQVRVSP